MTFKRCVLELYNLQNEVGNYRVVIKNKLCGCLSIKVGQKVYQYIEADISNKSNTRLKATKLNKNPIKQISVSIIKHFGNFWRSK